MLRSGILTRFLMGRFFSGVGTVMLTVCGIIFAITFVERLPSNPTAVSALWESWVRLIEYMPMFLPLAVFMGTLLASYKLTKSTESIIVSSTGMGPYQASRPFLIGSVLIGLIATMAINPYSVNISTQNITADNLQLIDNAIWLRESTKDWIITMRAKNVEQDGDALIFKNATILKQTPEFKLTERVEAAELRLSDNGLDSKRATIWDIKTAQETKHWHADTLLNPKTVLDRYLQPSQISFWELPAFIKKMGKIGAPVRGHLVQFWTLLFLPITMIAMTALGVAFSQTRQRRNYSFGIKFGIGVVTCFALYFLTNMFNALGATGALPALLAVTAPPVIIIAVAGMSIASFDAT